MNLNEESQEDGTVIVEGEIKRIKRFDDGYTILDVQLTKGKAVKLVGSMPRLAEGMNVRARTTITNHAKYGQQFKVLEIAETGFSSSDAIASYLASPAFPGIGAALARAIVSHFGMDTLKILDAEPERVEEVKAVPRSTCQIVVEQWKSQRSLHRQMSELMSLGLTVNLAMKVNKHFGELALEMVKSNPYCLTEISGVGFAKADEIAVRLGLDRTSPQRVQAAVKYILEQSLLGGDCYQIISVIAEKTVELLQHDINHVRVQEAVQQLVGNGTLASEDKGRFIFLSHIHTAEKQVAEQIREMLSYRTEPLYPTLEKLKERLATLDLGIALAPEQEEAIFTVMNSRVAIITGGPGTGKSTALKCLVAIFDHHNMHYELCAPTGRAAKRITETTQKPARTIHRLLETSQEGGFNYKQGNPLMTNVVVVDETSMVDVMLMRHLLDAMEKNQRLILVGDADQLPSVGPGSVLRDLIASEKVPTVKLERIFRQDKGSAIIVAAHDVLHGTMPHLPTPKNRKGGNCMFVGAGDQAELIQHILFLVGTALPNFGVPSSDIQVLTPMRERGLGINDLNPELQRILNPPSSDKEEVQTGARIFRVGDRVMQTSNDYKKGVFNGDMGVIAGITRISDASVMHIQYPDMENTIPYTASEWDALLHGYCITCHKAQGSEYPAVILICHPSQANMLQRNWLYTGMTRAKKWLIIAGTEDGVAMAVNNTKERQRNTMLRQRVQDTLDR